MYHFAKQGAALSDSNRMFDLSEEFPLLLAVRIFYENNKVICIEAVNLALKFDFPNGPAGKAGSMTTSEH